MKKFRRIHKKIAKSFGVPNSVLGKVGKVRVRKLITATKYNALMDRIIKKGLPVHETLIAMLAEASKYDLKKEK